MTTWSEYMETETYDDRDDEFFAEDKEDEEDEEFDDSGWGINEYSPTINIEQMIRNRE